MSDSITLSCPYCEASLGPDVLACRHCGRDLVPVLPLLKRLDALESKLSEIQRRSLATSTDGATSENTGLGDGGSVPLVVSAPRSPRRYWVLLPGLLALLAAHAAVVLWLDLPLGLLRLASIVVPFAVGSNFMARRARTRPADLLICVLFAAASVTSMSAVLAWVDGVPVAPQDTAAWRESMSYVLSIALSFLGGMLFRNVLVGLTPRGMTSLAQVRRSLAAGGRGAPVDSIKVAELTAQVTLTIISSLASLCSAVFGMIFS